RLDVSVAHAAAPLIEPLACVLHAVERAPGWADREMVIFGAGVIGLITLALARAEGAAVVHVVEPNPARRTAALRLGADRAIVDVDDELSREEFDVAIDASGHPGAIERAVRALGP